MDPAYIHLMKSSEVVGKFSGPGTSWMNAESSREHNPKNVQKSGKKITLELQILAQSWDFDGSEPLKS